jgi:hypothetical protein
MVDLFSHPVYSSEPTPTQVGCPEKRAMFDSLLYTLAVRYPHTDGFLSGGSPGSRSIIEWTVSLRRIRALHLFPCISIRFICFHLRQIR